MKKWMWAVVAAALLLVAYFVIETPFEDKIYANPIGEDVTALEFCLADGSATFLLEDQETIARLRSAYRWTNYHMYCCLAPEEVYARVYEVVGGTRNPREPMKVYDSWDVPSFNLEFRLLLKKVCDDALGGT